MKQCQEPNCPNYVWSHNYCKHHQTSRTDQKWLDTIEKRKSKVIVPIRKVSAKKSLRGDSEKILMETIIATRKHISFITGQKINNISYANCCHVLNKKNFPNFRLLDKNIVFLDNCYPRLEHFLYDMGTEDQRQKYAEEMKEQGIIVYWPKLYNLAAELKIEYNERL